MPVCNKETHIKIKIRRVLPSALYKYYFSLLKNVSSDMLLAARTVRYSVTSLIFTSRVSNSYFKRGTYNPDCEVS
jgi:hypothetical protein